MRRLVKSGAGVRHEERLTAALRENSGLDVADEGEIAVFAVEIEPIPHQEEIIAV